MGAFLPVKMRKRQRREHISVVTVFPIPLRVYEGVGLMMEKEKRLESGKGIEDIPEMPREISVDVA